jgi:predicted ester cyclase
MIPTMSSAEASAPGAGANRPSIVYKSFLDALNRHDLDAATRCVNVERYRENCVAYTKSFVDWEDAKASVLTIWKALPDLRVELHELAEGADYALARGNVRGTAQGRLYGAPATKRSFEANFFDYVKIENGLIVERVQQSDVLGQMRQLYGRAVGLVGVGAMFLRQ